MVIKFDVGENALLTGSGLVLFEFKRRVWGEGKGLITVWGGVKQPRLVQNFN